MFLFVKSFAQKCRATPSGVPTAGKNSSSTVIVDLHAGNDIPYVLPVAFFLGCRIDGAKLDVRLMTFRSHLCPREYIFYQTSK